LSGGGIELEQAIMKYIMIKVRVKIGFEWLYSDITPPWRVYRVFVVFSGEKKNEKKIDNFQSGKYFFLFYF
jgi:hypothetical protein